MRALLALLLALPASATVRGSRPGAPVPGGTPAVPAALGAPELLAPQPPALAGPAAPEVAAPLALPAQPFVAPRAASEIVREVEAVHADLADIHVNEAAERKVPDERKRGMRERLDRTARAVPGRAPEGEFADLSGALKQLRAERDLVQRRLREILRGAEGDIDAVGAQALELDRGVLKAQLAVALAMLNGKSGLRSRPALRNAALWTLDGAWHSAASLRAEVGYREARSARARRLSAPPPSAPAGPATAITQSRWRNALTTLDEAGRDLRNGRREPGLAKIELLIGAYSSREEGDRQSWPRYEAIARALTGLRDAPDTFPEARERLGKLIVHPKIAVRQTIAYKDQAAAARSQDHGVASNDAEAAVVARQIALLEYAREAVRIAQASNRPIPEDDRRRVADDLAAMRAWTERGLVDGKQDAALALANAERSLGAGDLAMVGRHLGSARAALAERLAELDRIAGGMRRRGARLAPPAGP